MILLKDVFIPGENEWVRRDVVIEEGEYRKISLPGELPGDGRVIQCEGRYLFPSFIDPHVHVREPGYDYKEDWETCTRAAVKGGVTAIFDMPNNKIIVADKKTLREKAVIAMRKSYVNFGLYIALTDGNVEEIQSSDIQDAVCGIKIYLSKTTGKITVQSEQALINVFNQERPVLVHTGGIDGLERVLFCYEKASKKFRGVSVLYICHVSTGEEVSLLKKWKRKYPRIHAEVSPHHLYLNTDNYSGYRGVLPPLSSSSNNDALWEGIREGTIDVLGSDHAPHSVEEKKGPNPPSGFPGLETSLPLMFNAYKEKRLNLEQLIRLTSGNIRRLFQLRGSAGIRENEVADCTLLEEGEYSIGEDGYVTKCGWSPFHGWKSFFRPVITFVNGSIACEKGKFIKTQIHNLCH